MWCLSAETSPYVSAFELSASYSYFSIMNVSIRNECGELSVVESSGDDVARAFHTDLGALSVCGTCDVCVVPIECIGCFVLLAISSGNYGSTALGDIVDEAVECIWCAMSATVGVALS